MFIMLKNSHLYSILLDTYVGNITLKMINASIVVMRTVISSSLREGVNEEGMWGVQECWQHLYLHLSGDKVRVCNHY